MFIDEFHQQPPGELPQAWDRDAARGDAAEPVERRLARLAASVGPLRRVLAAIVARLIAINAWERLGYARLSDYARERAGLSARQLQELARVHRALAALPAVECALVANTLPWSKVRLVTRVATAGDERDWIEKARAQTARALERELRERALAAQPEGMEDAEPTTRVTLRCTPAVREKWSLVSEVAERVAGQRLCAGEVLELVSAELFSELSIAPAIAEDFAERSAPRRRESSRVPDAA